MPFVSVTRLRIKASGYMPQFVWYTLRSYWQARRTPGNIAVKMLADADRAYWTKSVWKDEASMRAFMLSGPHKKVMPKLLDWCDEAHVAHWIQESSEPPSWLEAHRRLVAEGRKSKVRHPSRRHNAMSFPKPRI